MPTENRWTVRYTEAGQPTMLRPGPRAEIEECFSVLVQEDPDAQMVDLLAELEAAWPVGTRVRAGVDDRSPGSPGVVVTQRAGSAPITLDGPPDEEISVQLGHNGAGYVCVRLDGIRHPNWFAANYVTKENPTTDAAH